MSEELVPAIMSLGVNGITTHERMSYERRMTVSGPLQGLTCSFDWIRVTVVLVLPLEKKRSLQALQVCLLHQFSLF